MQQPLPINPSGVALDVTWDWTAWLGDDTIASFTVTPSSGLSVSNSARTGGKIVAFVSPTGSPVHGTQLSAVCSITTANSPPRTDSRTMTFFVQVL